MSKNNIHKLSREVTYTTMDKNNTPSLFVNPKDTVSIKTELNGGAWLQTTEDTWAPDKSNGPNRAVVLGVNGAHPGDTLAIKIKDIQVEEIGYTGFAGWRNKLSQQIWPNDWDIVTKTVSIKNNEILWSDSLKLPIIPMIGTIGTAPGSGSLSNQYAYPTGGNMDVQEICPGTTLYLPIEVEGALLHIGDVHAIMGDGEIPHGGGIECRSTVILQVDVQEGYKSKKWIRAENEKYIMTIANNVKMKDSFCGAANELIYWMQEGYGFNPKEAFLLLGQVLEARCTMLHGDTEPFSPYICKIKKCYLKPDKNFEG